MLASLYKCLAKNNIPFACIVELTRRCNLSCVHCYATTEPRKELTLRQHKRIIDQLYDMGSLFITFTGGEPLVNKNWWQILKYASDKRMCVQLFTNATLIDKGVAERLAKINMFHIGVSVYGATAKTHDKITGCKGSFKKTIDGVKLLKKYKLHTVLKFIIMNKNIMELNMMVRMADDLGMIFKIDFNITPRDNFSRDTLKLRIGCVDATKICRMLYDTSFRKHRVFDDLRDLRCGAGRTLVSINAYGDVYPCIQLPVLAGNVCYLSFKEIWQKAPFLKFVRKFPQPQKIDVCRRCEIRQYCLRCPGSVYMETDNFYAASPSVCKLAEIWKRLEARQKGLSTS